MCETEGTAEIERPNQELAASSSVDDKSIAANSDSDGLIPADWPRHRTTPWWLLTSFLFLAGLLHAFEVPQANWLYFELDWPTLVVFAVCAVLLFLPEISNSIVPLFDSKKVHWEFPWLKLAFERGEAPDDESESVEEVVQRLTKRLLTAQAQTRRSPEADELSGDQQDRASAIGQRVPSTTSNRNEAEVDEDVSPNPPIQEVEVVRENMRQVAYYSQLLTVRRSLNVLEQFLLEPRHAPYRLFRLAVYQLRRAAEVFGEAENVSESLDELLPLAEQLELLDQTASNQMLELREVARMSQQNSSQNLNEQAESVLVALRLFNHIHASLESYVRREVFELNPGMARSSTRHID